MPTERTIADLGPDDVGCDAWHWPQQEAELQLQLMQQCHNSAALFGGACTCCGLLITLLAVLRKGPVRCHLMRPAEKRPPAWKEANMRGQGTKAIASVLDTNCAGPAPRWPGGTGLGKVRPPLRPCCCFILYEVGFTNSNVIWASPLSASRGHCNRSCGVGCLLRSASTRA